MGDRVQGWQLEGVAWIFGRNVARAEEIGFKGTGGGETFITD